MSSLIVSRDSQILMLELLIDKLFVPNTSPFDAVILSKFIVSFRFLDDDWIDVTPNRLDYKNYRGSNGEVQSFHGGKSIVFSVPESMLGHEQKNLELEVKVRREISRYFETGGLGHVMDVGRTLVNVDDLFNGLVKELRIRCDLGDYLQVAHERDPISRSLRGKFELSDGQEGTELELYVRLSHLGGCVVTEIDRPSRGELLHFYAQEEMNLGKPYECLELEADRPRPDARIAPLTALKARPSLQLVCDCSEEQRYQLLLDECSKTQGTGMDGEDDNGDKKRKKNGDAGGRKDRKKKKSEKGVNTDAETADKSSGTPGQGLDEDADKNKKSDGSKSSKKRRGAGPMIYIEKCQPCPPPEPCVPCCPVVCDIPCLPAPICPPPVCCYE